ncbi:unnamed protein product [Closterium sp. NIES-54]
MTWLTGPSSSKRLLWWDIPSSSSPGFDSCTLTPPPASPLTTLLDPPSLFERGSDKDALSPPSSLCASLKSFSVTYRFFSRGSPSLRCNAVSWPAMLTMSPSSSPPSESLGPHLYTSGPSPQSLENTPIGTNAQLSLFTLPRNKSSWLAPFPFALLKRQNAFSAYVERAQPGATTWSTTLSRVQRMAKFLAALRATATCRKSLALVFLNSIISFPGRFQPPSPDIIKRLDVLVGDFLSSSHFKEHGLAVCLIPNRLLYNTTRHGGLGAIAPSTQIRALAAHRALRRLGVSPSEEVARAAVCLPFGTHCLLAHPAILQSGILATVIPSRALAELHAMIEITPDIAPPRLVPMCIMAEPTAFNRFILKPNGKPFGILTRERFLSYPCRFVSAI